MSDRQRPSPIARPAVLVALLLVAVSAASQERLTISADRLEAVTAEGRERTVLVGNARVESERFLILAEEIEIYGDEQRYVVSTGGVTAFDHENDLYLESDELFYDRTSDFVRAAGNAYMEDRTNDVVVKGELIQNWNDLDLTEISVNVRILGDDYTARGQFARYRRSADTLELSGTPEVFWMGDEYHATRIVIDLENDEVELLGDVRAVVRQQETTGEETAPGDGGAPTDEATRNDQADSEAPDSQATDTTLSSEVPPGE